MDSVLWLFGSIVFLVPVIFMLPLGISKTGKIVILFTSLSVAHLGLLAVKLYNPFISNILILTILLLVTYILHYRWSNTMYTLFHTNDSSDEEEMEMQEYLDQYRKPKSDGLVKDFIPDLSEQSNIRVDVKTFPVNTVDLSDNKKITEDISTHENEISFLWDREVKLKLDFSLNKDEDEKNKSIFRTEKDFDEVYDVDWSLLEVSEESNRDVEREKQLV